MKLKLIFLFLGCLFLRCNGIEIISKIELPKEAVLYSRKFQLKRNFVPNGYRKGYLENNLPVTIESYGTLNNQYSGMNNYKRNINSFKKHSMELSGNVDNNLNRYLLNGAEYYRESPKSLSRFDDSSQYKIELPYQTQSGSTNIYSFSQGSINHDHRLSNNIGQNYAEVLQDLTNTNAKLASGVNVDGNKIGIAWHQNNLDSVQGNTRGSADLSLGGSNNFNRYNNELNNRRLFNLYQNDIKNSRDITSLNLKNIMHTNDLDAKNRNLLESNNEKLNNPYLTRNANGILNKVSNMESLGASSNLVSENLNPNAFLSNYRNKCNALSLNSLKETDHNAPVSLSSTHNFHKVESIKTLAHKISENTKVSSSLPEDQNVYNSKANNLQNSANILAELNHNQAQVANENKSNLKTEQRIQGLGITYENVISPTKNFEGSNREWDTGFGFEALSHRGRDVMLQPGNLRRCVPNKFSYYTDQEICFCDSNGYPTNECFSKRGCNCSPVPIKSLRKKRFVDKIMDSPNPLSSQPTDKKNCLLNRLNQNDKQNFDNPLQKNQDISQTKRKKRWLNWLATTTTPAPPVFYIHNKIFLPSSHAQDQIIGLEQIPREIHISRKKRCTDKPSKLQNMNNNAVRKNKRSSLYEPMNYRGSNNDQLESTDTRSNPIEYINSEVHDLTNMPSENEDDENAYFDKLDISGLVKNVAFGASSGASIFAVSNFLDKSEDTAYLEISKAAAYGAAYGSLNVLLTNYMPSDKRSENMNTPIRHRRDVEKDSYDEINPKEIENAAYLGSLAGTRSKIQNTLNYLKDLTNAVSSGATNGALDAFYAVIMNNANNLEVLNAIKSLTIEKEKISIIRKISLMAAQQGSYIGKIALENEKPLAVARKLAETAAYNYAFEENHQLSVLLFSTEYQERQSPSTSEPANSLTSSQLNLVDPDYLHSNNKMIKNTAEFSHISYSDKSSSIRPANEQINQNVLFAENSDSVPKQVDFKPYPFTDSLISSSNGQIDKNLMSSQNWVTDPQQASNKFSNFPNYLGSTRQLNKQVLLSSRQDSSIHANSLNMISNRQIIKKPNNQQNLYTRTMEKNLYLPSNPSSLPLLNKEAELNKQIKMPLNPYFIYKNQASSSDKNDRISQYNKPLTDMSSNEFWPAENKFDLISNVKKNVRKIKNIKTTTHHIEAVEVAKQEHARNEK